MYSPEPGPAQTNSVFVILMVAWLQVLIAIPVYFGTRKPGKRSRAAAAFGWVGASILPAGIAHAIAFRKY